MNPSCKKLFSFSVSFLSFFFLSLCPYFYLLSYERAGKEKSQPWFVFLTVHYFWSYEMEQRVITWGDEPLLACEERKRRREKEQGMNRSMFKILKSFVSLSISLTSHSLTYAFFTSWYPSTSFSFPPNPNVMGLQGEPTLSQVAALALSFAL